MPVNLRCFDTAGLPIQYCVVMAHSTLSFRNLEACSISGQRDELSDFSSVIKSMYFART